MKATATAGATRRPQIPPFTRLADALQWALERIARANLERGPYFDQAAAALDDATRGNVFRVVELAKVDPMQGRRFEIWQRVISDATGAAWRYIGRAFDDRTPFPQAKAADLAGRLELALRDDLERELTRAAVRALEAQGRDPFRVLVIGEG